ncbi:uncharacterized protein LOC109793573 [Cajanus cajan]|uniref:uncharacterized protein LOC109793573 n=1 Tax=Cajanus cajan TaxID=3821 RepID=UPI00098D7B09|nr:uncharacterized protein LOC109793573 [Cajanus cajan]
MKEGRRESEVAEILLKLPTLIWEFHSLAWGCKKKRSAIALHASSSPAIPFSFSFSPSHSHHPTTLFSLKRKREQYLNIIQQLTKDNHVLYGEINNVECYFQKLKDCNFKLKARKQELSRGLSQGVPEQQPQLQLQFPHHPPPLIANQTAGPAQISGGESVAQQQACGRATTSLGVASFSNNVGPNGIPDLNLPLDESMAMDFGEALDVNLSVANKNLSRAVAAQARQNRLNIYRFKKPIGTSKLRYSCRS